ncbi:MAG: hypothetical protein J6R47_04240 [Acholeplasmatales bacterium]|nr:hypothetical protein [Acholeplasmatales bacterium]
MDRQSIRVADTPMFHIDNRNSEVFGLLEVGEPTLEITGLKMVQFIFSGCYQYYEEPSIFDQEYIVINGMKFKRVRDE